ncbi:MAG: hemolysin family protein [Pseudomonadota bacterium]
MTNISDPDGEDPPQSWPRLFGFGKKPDESADTKTNGSDNGQAEPQQMRLRIAEFEQLRVDDVMIPRADIIAVEVATTLEELVKAFADATHSRLPVYKETLDDPLGFVHIKDVVTELARGGDAAASPIDRLMRNILFVPPSMGLPDLLLKMQTTRNHLALVVDEYGGTDGLVSMEDLVEEIVGDIEDEHDDATALFIKRGKSLWEADARMEIDDFAGEAHIDLSLDDYEDEIDTLGGVAFALAGKVPTRGEILRHPAGADIEIVDADARRIRRLKIRIDADAGATDNQPR